MSKLAKIYLTVPSEVKDLASDFFLGLGAISTSEDSTGKDFLISALFPADMDLEPTVNKFRSYMEFLKNDLLHLDFGEINIGHVDNSSWDEWKKRLKKVKIGNVCITPPWGSKEHGENELLVVINPSMAFGTGHHETTKLCIEYIESLSSNKDLSTILDIGCGSGVLSIVAVKLGIRKAVCVDIDPTAIKETKSNLARNKVKNRVTSLCGSIHSVRGTYDIVVANISLQTILSMKTELRARLLPGGFLILSGILSAQREQLIREFINAGFKQIGEKTKREWIGVVFTLK